MLKTIFTASVCVCVCVYMCVCVCVCGVCVCMCVCVYVLTNNIAPTGAQVKHTINSPTKTSICMTNHITINCIKLQQIASY